MEKYLNSENIDLLKIADLYKNQYFNSKPFPNIHFENFFTPSILESILDEFPDLSKVESLIYKNKREIKLAGKGEIHFGTMTKDFMRFLNSEPFLNFLQILTGTKDSLIGDPYFWGGGQHEIKKGGLLKIHADFNKHPTFDLDRRINVLIYLNKEWKEEYGGYLELWDKNMEKCEKRILPQFNTLVVFSTTDFSYHGHPDPLNCPQNMSRKSLALYYYSNGRPLSEIKDQSIAHSTLFKERANNMDDKIALKKNKTLNIRSIITLITPPIIIKTMKIIFNKK